MFFFEQRIPIMEKSMSWLVGTIRDCTELFFLHPIGRDLVWTSVVEFSEDKFFSAFHEHVLDFDGFKCRCSPAIQYTFTLHIFSARLS